MKNEINTRISLRLALTCILSAWFRSALALDLALDVNQYAHTAWKIRDGFSGDVIYSLAQTPDGYLWLGTTAGLRRFDGVRNLPWQPPAGTSLPDERVRALLAARDGTLWIGTQGGLASLKDGKLVTYPRLAGYVISGLAEDREGTVWVGAVAGTTTGLLCAVRGIDSKCHGEEGTFGAWVGSLYEDSKGILWASAANGLWRWRPGAPMVHALAGDGFASAQPLSETATGAILVVTGHEISQIADSAVEPFPNPGLPEHGQPNALLRDRDGALWIGAFDGGVYHVHNGHVDKFGRSDGLSGDRVQRLFEDREGNVWVLTQGGLDRFRVLAADTYSAAQGVSGLGLSVAADRNGSVWISTTTGFYRWHDGRIATYSARREHSSVGSPPTAAQPETIEAILATGLPEPPAASLFQDSRGRVWLGLQSRLGYLAAGHFVSVGGLPGGYIDSIDEDGDGNLWIAHRDAGLLQLSGDRVVQQIPWTKVGQSGHARRLAIDRAHGGLWLGFLSGRVAHFVNGEVRASYSVRDGLGKGFVNDLRVAPDGTLWVATDGGLSRLKDGRIATLDRNSGLRCDAVDSTIEDDDASTWLYTACGLVRIPRSDLDAWAAAAEQGKSPQRIQPEVLDGSDGVRSIATPLTTYSPHIAKARDGKLWFATYDGVMVVDPRHLPFNKLPPPVHVEEITADRKTYEPSKQLSLPPLVRDLQIDYTALSFVAPEKNRFRYKLEGRDREWQDAGNRRQAFYTDLDPGHYRFRVIASNNSGVWNEEGATLDFSIAPAYWQTNWFRALCVLAFIGLLLGLYLLRVRQLARQFNMTLDARVNERTRIARDLHDTLLQSFHGLLLRFQTASTLLPARPAQAKEVLDSAIDQAAEAITEGRDAVQGLRSSTMETNDLAEAIRTVGEELAADEGANRGAVLRVEAQGAPGALHPIVRDEILRIASEALRNAFRHAEAKQIEVELRYDERDLRLRVRDDGKGIDPKVVSQGGREGHFGMHGMRERAKLIGGKLTVWSGLDSGTEVELSIPAARAYTSSSTSTWRSRLREKLYGQRTTSE